MRMSRSASVSGATPCSRCWRFSSSKAWSPRRLRDMTELSQPIARLLTEVRARRRRLLVYGGVARTALVAAVSLLVVLALAAWAGRSPVAVTVLVAVGFVAVVGAATWGLRGIRRRPSDTATARLIEEH